MRYGLRARGFALSVAPVAQRGGQQPPHRRAPIAPIDLTGYWVSIVTEDWRWRMVTPPKGDYASVPLNAGGRARSPTRGTRRRTKPPASSAGPTARRRIMRVPGRLHITWQDDNTLKIDTDAGTQTRLFRFGVARTSAG